MRDALRRTGFSTTTSWIQDVDGVLYHHILDPETGYPVMNSLWGVTIISDSSLTGDALSTVCMLIGKEAAADLIERTDGVRAVFVDDHYEVTQCE